MNNLSAWLMRFGLPRAKRIGFHYVWHCCLSEAVGELEASKREARALEHTLSCLTLGEFQPAARWVLRERVTLHFAHVPQQFAIFCR